METRSLAPVHGLTLPSEHHSPQSLVVQLNLMNSIKNKRMIIEHCQITLCNEQDF